MLFVVGLVAALSAVANAAIPIWSLDGCGRSKYGDAGEMPLPPGQRIVGGQAAREHEFPWQVSVRRASTDAHFCGGSIINRNWILTAAHCMSGELPARVSVVVGDHVRNQAVNPSRQTLAVSRIIVHQQYNSNNMQNDVALIQTSTQIALNENVFPVCAPDSANQYVYYLSQVSGWGTLQSGGVCCPQTLQYVTVNVTTNAFCDQRYVVARITDDMICASDNAGGNERDSCQGDSGGPLTIKESDGTFRVVGIVSWGNGCASGWPGVYARVGFFNDWITNAINSF